MTRRWTSLAVDALHATVNDNIATELRAVETERGLSAGYLTDPYQVIKARSPLFNYSPEVQVYQTSWRWQLQRCRVMDVECQIALSFSLSTDLEESEEFVRDWVSAVVECITKRPTLDARVVKAVYTAGASASTIGDSSAIRHVELIDVRVTVHCEE